MEIFWALVLGIVQGFAEFLPISSSGHLRLIQDMFLLPETFGLAFDVLLHIGTLLAVVVYFRGDLAHMASAVLTNAPERQDDRRLLFLIVVATVPTGLIGLFGADWFENVPTLFIGIGLVVTALLLKAADRLSRRSIHSAGRLGYVPALLIGVAQGLAIMPGISRSGATMAAGLGLGLDREQAARFSFLLSIPVILLASMKEGYEVVVLNEPIPGTAAILVGLLASTITGYIAIAGLMRFIKSNSFTVFSIYTAILGVAVIIWQTVG
ncbi:MAG: undecaprenyl-diphosphate phosphatase [Actinobacteria bacterium]|nr:undecaprenyl-diphosphate phosphatase [Actinomycetota bacterium]MCL5887580.1 undecaprenyl-diphosphate phosphatase [Actinomycetota bacterium]